jgi:hypothetical protein
MVLAPLLEVEEYFEFYRSVTTFKILDNGAAEGYRIDPEQLLKYAFQLQVDEVIAPDAYGDMHRTQYLLRQFKPMAENYHVMAVLQSRTWPEFDNIFHLALSLDVQSVALPRVMCQAMGPSARLAAAEIVRRESNIPIHALGCTNHLREGRDLARQGIVRGIDSSAPVALGLHGRRITELYTERPHDFFTRKSAELDLARRNVDAFRLWCQETPASEV